MQQSGATGHELPTAYRGRILSPVSYDGYTEHVDGALVVDSGGTILAVGSWEAIAPQFQQFAQVYDYGKRIILPGFIDLHAHLVQIAQTGRAGDTLLGWLKKYIFPAEARFADLMHARKLADWFFHELARNGTTLAAVFTSIHEEATDLAFQTAADYGCRVIMGKVLMDRNAPDNLVDASVSESLESSARLCTKWHGYDNGRLMYAFTPRFAPTSTTEQLKGVSRLWSSFPGTYLQTHLSENIAEIDWVKELFPDCAGYVDVYASHGLVGKDALFAHSIHLSDEEIDLLKHSGSSVVHCPSSNFFLKSGVFPYRRMRSQGMKIGLGSDVAGGPEMSMFQVMKDAAYIQPESWPAPRELFYLATLGGATAVNLQSTIGSLEPGKEADFIVIDPTLKSAVAFDILDHCADDILSSLVYVGDNRMIVATYVRGRPIFQMQEVHDRQSSFERVRARS